MQPSTSVQILMCRLADVVTVDKDLRDDWDHAFAMWLGPKQSSAIGPMLLGQMTGIPRNNLPSMELQTACALIESGTMSTDSMLGLLCAAHESRMLRLIAMILFHCWDETPVHLRMAQPTLVAEEHQLSLVLQVPVVGRKGHETNKCCVKVVQSEPRLAFAFEKPNGDESAISSYLPHYLMAIDRGTGEAYTEVVRRLYQPITNLSRAMALAPARFGGAGKDRDPANGRVMEAIRHEWKLPLLDMDCDAHKGFSSQGAQMHVARKDVSGMIHLCVGQRNGDDFSVFKQVLAFYLIEFTQHYKNALPPDADSPIGIVRDGMRDLFYTDSGGVEDQVTRIIMDEWINGDPDADHPEHYCQPEHCPAGQASYNIAVKTQIVPAIAPAMIALFNRGRWTGAQKSIRGTGKLVSVSKLCFRWVVTVWLVCIKQKRGPKLQDFHDCDVPDCSAIVAVGAPGPRGLPPPAKSKTTISQVQFADKDPIRQLAAGEISHA